MRERGAYPIIDEIAVGAAGKLAIRGREQQLYDYYRLKGIQLRNEIRPVAKWNEFGYLFHTRSNLMFGELAPYSGYMYPGLANY